MCYSIRPWLMPIGSPPRSHTVPPLPPSWHVESDNFLQHPITRPMISARRQQQRQALTLVNSFAHCCRVTRRVRVEKVRTNNCLLVTSACPADSRLCAYGGHEVTSLAPLLYALEQDGSVIVSGLRWACLPNTSNINTLFHPYVKSSWIKPWDVIFSYLVEMLCKVQQLAKVTKLPIKVQWRSKVSYRAENEWKWCTNTITISV